MQRQCSADLRSVQKEFRFREHLAPKHALALFHRPKAVLVFFSVGALIWFCRNVIYYNNMSICVTIISGPCLVSLQPSTMTCSMVYLLCDMRFALNQWNYFTINDHFPFLLTNPSEFLCSGRVRLRNSVPTPKCSWLVASQTYARTWQPLCSSPMNCHWPMIR